MHGWVYSELTVAFIAASVQELIYGLAICRITTNEDQQANRPQLDQRSKSLRRIRGSNMPAITVWPTCRYPQSGYCRLTSAYTNTIITSATRYSHPSLNFLSELSFYKHLHKFVHRKFFPQGYATSCEGRSLRHLFPVRWLLWRMFPSGSEVIWKVGVVEEVVSGHGGELKAVSHLPTSPKNEHF